MSAESNGGDVPNTPSVPDNEPDEPTVEELLEKFKREWPIEVRREIAVAARKARKEDLGE